MASRLLLFSVLFLFTVSERVQVAQFGNARVFVDNAYGTPVIQGGSVHDVFAGVGYMHARERLWQVFLRYLAGTGRLAEFLGAGQGDINLATDIRTRTTMYTPEEMERQYQLLSDHAKDAHAGFAIGFQARVKEVNMDAALLPYEFKQSGIDVVPEELFSLENLLLYGLELMRALADGHYPSYQLDQLTFLQELQDRLPLQEAQDVFDDLVTVLGAFPLNHQVAPRTSEEVPRMAYRRKPARLVRAHRADMARLRIDRDKAINAHLLEQGIITQDGSWTIVVGPDRSTSKHAMLHGAPQDPLPFPNQFFEVFAESAEAGVNAHWFAEPGTPQNQLYGAFGNFSIGRNRGYLPANDFLFENDTQAMLHHSDIVLVRDGEAVELDVYRSRTGGFVVDRYPEMGEILTLRSVFMEKELPGFSSLTELFFANSFQEFQDAIMTSSLQSHLTHSHLGYADNKGTIAALLNGLWTDLSSVAPDYDRRLPQGAVEGVPIPAYSCEQVCRQPVIDIDHPQGYYVGWNGPFNEALPWFGTRNYGGDWRGQWMVDYIVDHGQLSWQEMQDLIAHASKANFLKTGGNGAFDSFARGRGAAMMDRVAAAPTPDRDAAMHILADYRGEAVVRPDDTLVTEGFLLANTWTHRVLNLTMMPLLANTMFRVRDVDTTTNGALPTSSTPQRLQNVLDLFFSDTPTHYDWLATVDLDQMVLEGLDQALATLGERPWSIEREPRDFVGVGGILGVVASVPNSQLPSFNLAVDLDHCGPLRFVSSSACGVSGFVSGESDAPVFGPHTMDQQELYAGYAYRPSFSRFERAIVCAEVELEANWVVGSVVSVSGVLVLLLGGFCLWYRVIRPQDAEKKPLIA